MSTELIIIILLANLFGFYMAWGIGANDVANAMGTSVGSGALTLKRAVILAAILEFAGAFLVGTDGDVQRLAQHAFRLLVLRRLQANP